MSQVSVSSGFLPMSQQSVTTRFACNALVSMHKEACPSELISAFFRTTSAASDATDEFESYPATTYSQHNNNNNNNNKRKRSISDVDETDECVCDEISDNEYEASENEETNDSVVQKRNTYACTEVLYSALAVLAAPASDSKRKHHFATTPSRHQCMPPRPSHTFLDHNKLGKTSGQTLINAMRSPNVSTIGVTPYDLESCQSDGDHQARGQYSAEYFTQDDCSIRSPSPPPPRSPVRVSTAKRKGKGQQMRAKHPKLPSSSSPSTSLNGVHVEVKAACGVDDNDEQALCIPSPVLSSSSTSGRKYDVEDLRAALQVLADGSKVIGIDIAEAIAVTSSQTTVLGKRKSHRNAAQTNKNKNDNKKPTVRATAKTFGIPPETLRRFWKKVSQEPTHEQRSEIIRSMSFPLLGNQRKRYFSEADERELALSLIHKRGEESTGFSDKQISVIVRKEAQRRGVAHARCGKRWVNGFMRRNQAILGHWRQNAKENKAVKSKGRGGIASAGSSASNSSGSSRIRAQV